METLINILQKIQLKQPEKQDNLSHNKTITFPENFQVRNDYDTLVLSGGGNKGIIQLGILHSFHQKLGDEFINHIKKYYGTSIGSVICLLMSIGLSPVDIFVEVCKSRINPTLEINIPNFLMNFGFYSSSNVFEDINKIIYNKLGKIPTLKELYDTTKKEVYIVCHNLTKNKAVYLHYSTHPDLSCIEALKMSCNIPIIFEKIMYDNCYYIDGAFSMNGNYPIKYASSFEDNKNILAIKVSKSSKEKEWNLLTYLENIAKISIRSNDEDFSCDKLHNINIYIDEDKKEWDFNLENTKYKFSLFSIGYSEGIKLLNKKEENVEENVKVGEEEIVGEENINEIIEELNDFTNIKQKTD